MFQKDDGKSPTVLGYTAFVGTGHSMEPEIYPGTLEMLNYYKTEVKENA